MNRIAANPLMINAGGYWLMESNTAGDCLAKTGARKPKFPCLADEWQQVVDQGLGDRDLTVVTLALQRQGGSP
jgi:hypothetical protein